MNDLLFNQNVTVTREELVDAASAYIGIPYCRNSSWIEWVSFAPVGRLSCFGLFLQVAKDVALLPSDFDICLSPENFGGRKKAAILHEILELNFDPVQHKEVGDVLILRFEGAKNPHHVALCSGPNEIIDACGRNAADTGFVARSRMDALMQRRIVQIWRLANLG